MKPITPHLWFDQQAREAALFYCSVFPNSKITSSTPGHSTRPPRAFAHG
jgi:predicted 3-demethylubiquinone-9 3-methyltransferase (glyoxalase superfamily)